VKKLDEKKRREEVEMKDPWSKLPRKLLNEHARTKIIGMFERKPHNYQYGKQHLEIPPCSQKEK
jgi:hypothetical protein